MRKFWNWAKNEAGERTIYINGYIAEESWYDDDVTPKEFKAELDAGEGDIVVWINSGGGDCFAASQIYTMLKEYKGGTTANIDGIAASAASVIAMACDNVCMSPTANMMIHNPATIAWGEKGKLEKVIEMLNTIKESIINAYELKTKLPREKISSMMDAETWFDAKKAVDLGFADKILYTEGAVFNSAGILFDKATVTNMLINKLPRKLGSVQTEKTGILIENLEKRLSLLKY